MSIVVWVMIVHSLVGDYWHFGGTSPPSLGWRKVEAMCSSEILVITYKITQHHNWEDHSPYFHYCESVKFHILILMYRILLSIDSFALVIWCVNKYWCNWLFWVCLEIGMKLTKAEVRLFLTFCVMHKTDYWLHLRISVLICYSDRIYKETIFFEQPCLLW
jgi:hypothetical protein